jgi:hypothetical protein
VSKLTLSVDPGVVARAKRYAKRQGVSVSGLVETYLATVSAAQPLREKEPPILRALRGSLKTGDIKDYRKHLVEKYR